MAVLISCRNDLGNDIAKRRGYIRGCEETAMRLFTEKLFCPLNILSCWRDRVVCEPYCVLVKNDDIEAIFWREVVAALGLQPAWWVESDFYRWKRSGRWGKWYSANAATRDVSLGKKLHLEEISLSMVSGSILYSDSEIIAAGDVANLQKVVAPCRISASRLCMP